MLLVIALAVLPFVALIFNIALAIRLLDQKYKSWATYVIAGGPVAGLLWSFIGGAFLARDTFNFYVGVALVFYGAVLTALFEVLSERLFKAHTLWALFLTVPSILSVIVWGGLQ